MILSLPRYRLSQQSQPSHQDAGMMQLDVPTSHQPVQGQALGQKLKNSYSFRDRKDPQNLSNRSANNPPPKQKPRPNSVESHHSFRSTTRPPNRNLAPTLWSLITVSGAQPAPQTETSHQLCGVSSQFPEHNPPPKQK